MLNWIVAGIGDIAIKRVIPAIQAEPRSILYGVVTRDPAKGSTYAPHVFTDFQQAIADPQVHAVYIATPVSYHAPQSIATLRAGKHVLCEKPVALTYPQACEMRDAADATGKTLGIAYYRRTYPKVLRAMELLAQGVIGRPVLAEISCHDWFNAEAGRDWLVDPHMAGGGPLFDIASHRIDLLNYFFGQPSAVTGQRSNHIHQRAVEDSATVLIEYPNGVRGVVDVRWHCRAGRDEFRITGTEAVMDLSPLNGPSLRYRNIEEQLPAHSNLHYPCVENFVDHILTGAGLKSSIHTAILTDWVTSQVPPQG
ncbi:MAG: Gfo/Idh/MocA family oxidoreductase [Bryobacteraceae bacterium]